MPAVKRLPEHLANQIAAGEVVERPSSVVKELVENALDAGAGRVEVRLSQGGKRLIEVRDDGHGMSKEDLELSVEPHATSKIETEEDLECIRTLGFRGEALASIGAVSVLSIASRQEAAEGGWKVRVSFGTKGPAVPHACPPGTIVSVEDLFRRVPARAKFLKSDQTEYARCLKMVHLFCASWPEVDFKVVKEERTVLVCRSDLPVQKRMEPLLGKKVVSRLIQVENVQEGAELRGFVAAPDETRLSSRNVHFFLNRRPVTSPVLWRALNDALKGFLVKGNHPAGVFFLEIDPMAVDVNVHPMKNEVRFERPSEIYRLVFHGLRRALEGRKEGTRVVLPSSFEPQNHASRDAGPEEPGRHPGKPQTIPLPWESGPDSESLAFEVEEGARNAYRGPGVEDVPPAEILAEVESHEDFRIIGQFADSFILYEYQGRLVVLDQHAAHEALIFKRMKEELFSSGRLRRQGLVVPMLMDVDPGLLEDFDPARRVLASLGIEAEVFGREQIVIRSLPVFLVSGPRTDEGVEEIVKSVLECAFCDQAELVRRVLAPMACAAAVRAGKALGDAEMQRLVSRCLEERVTNCPHGRPVAVAFSREELFERFFRK